MSRDEKKFYCDQCDPKLVIIYGFCKSCKRRCECPHFDEKSNMPLWDYEEFRRRWNEMK